MGAIYYVHLANFISENIKTKRTLYEITNKRDL